MTDDDVRRTPKPDPSQRRTRTEAEQERLVARRERSLANRRLMHERETDAWLQVLSRSPDWTCPDGETYTHAGPVQSDNPCDDFCIEGQCKGSAHRTLGLWAPNGDNTAWYFKPNRLVGEDDEEVAARYEANLPPVAHRAMRDNQTLTAWTADKGEPVAAVFCRAQNENGQRCNRRLANIYRHKRTYIIADGNHYTFAEGRAAHLNAAMQAREQGIGWNMAEAFEAAADVKVWPLILTLDPRSADDPLAGGRLGMPFDYLLIGCEHHGNVMASYARLRKLGKTGGHADVDAQLSHFWVLKSEMPAEG